MGEIAELLFGPDSEERRTALARMGLDERFVARVSQVFETGQSALLALLRYEDIADTDELLRTLNLFRGQLLQTTISQEILKNRAPLAEPCGL